MGKSSVVRRIDEFGRITVPKDMRDKLKIKDDEFIELVLDEEGIVLKKHLPLSKNEFFYDSYAKVINLETGINIAISDRDTIVATAGTADFKEKYLNKPVSVYLDEIIKNRDIIKSDRNEELVLAEGTKEKGRCIIAPICSEESAIGTVIICSESEEELDEFLVKTCQIAASFLGKNIHH